MKSEISKDFEKFKTDEQNTFKNAFVNPSFSIVFLCAIYPIANEKIKTTIEIINLHISACSFINSVKRTVGGINKNTDTVIKSAGLVFNSCEETNA
jgi:hypothetical protein